MSNTLTTDYRVFRNASIGGADTEFVQWWNAAGQFVQPIGDLCSPANLAFARKIAEGVWDEVNQETEKRINEIDEELAEEHRVLIRADCLIDDIEGCLRGGDPADALAEIKTFIEHYREQNK